MLLPPQNLKAAYTSGTIAITWQVAPTSDTPTEVILTLSDGGTSFQAKDYPSPNAPISYTVAATTVSQFAGTLVSVYVAFVNATLGESQIAATNVLVPGTAATPSNPPVPPGHYTVPPPDSLQVTPNPSNHSVEFQWKNHGPYVGVEVSWGVANMPPQDTPAPIKLPGSAQSVTLGPIYPNTPYVFQVKGGVTGGPASLNYSAPASLAWVSPPGSVPNVGWFPNWFPIEPGPVLEPSARGVQPGSVTASWRADTNNLHLDLFLSGGIPTLGEVWSSYWEPKPGWAAWFQAANAVWAPNVSVKLGATVTAIRRPGNTMHLDLFAVAGNGTVWSTWWEPSAGWQSWFEIRGVTATPGAQVTAVWRPDGGRLDLFVTSAAGALGVVWSTWWEPNKNWHAWFTVSNAVWRPNISVKAGAQVTALWRDSDHLDLFATANDGSAWSTWFEATPGWQSWFCVDSTPTGKLNPGAPITAIWSSSLTLELFSTRTDGTVLTTWWQSGQGWRGWTSTMDSSVKMQPGARLSVVHGYGAIAVLQLFATAADGVVWTASRTDAKPLIPWGRWLAVHPEMTAVPGTAVAALWRPTTAVQNHLDLFARRTDGSVWSIWWEAGYYS
jgi:hypothetical protein